MSKPDGSSTPTDIAASKNRREKPARNLPSKSLPTNRISFSKQIEILRAYAACSEPDRRPVTNSEVGAVVGMTSSTVSLGNAFFVSTGLLERTEAGSYIPSAEVASFYRAHSWDPDTAPHKMAPAIEKSWFAQALLPKLRFRAINEDQAIADLAEVATAGPEYRAQLKTLIDYLEAAGIIVKDNGTIKLAAPSAATPPPEPEVKAGGAASANGSAEKGSPGDAPTRFATTFAKTDSALHFSFSVNVDPQDVATWAPERISAFFRGVALVLAAKNARELKEVEKEVEKTAG